ncbi:MAG: VIT1/CCC1 transporter family protein [Patescibacteria group bacterium]|nr:VIT1/CCC1 transporter family protein [bacterium]MDZ4241079.1 VIT1/CCC1 transporter family protein [Patescibacteria group bacterium]
MHLSRASFLSYMRNFIFGAEDSLVSTVGLLAGIAAAGTEKREIVIAGLVLITVEAFSMGIGSYLSERSLSDSESKDGERKTIVGALIMLLSYALAGFIPLSPYLFLPIDIASNTSIGATLASLFLLGIISARALKTNVLKNAFRLLFFGGIASLLGIAVGIALK